MSWLISKALMNSLCSQELAVESLEENFSDGEQSVLSSGNNTPQAYCAPDKMMGFSRLSRFGMTYAVLTENLGEELLMSCRADFLAKTFPLQEKELELKGKEVECGEKWRGSFVKYDHDSSLWRTHQCSLLGDLEPYSETWPQWGLMRDGECWEQRTLEQTIRGTEFGSLQNKEMWPTPATKGYGHAAEGMVGNLIEKIEHGVITKLEAEQMLSLPKLENHRTWKKKFPTPQLADYKDRGNMSNPSIQRRAEIGKQVTLSMVAHPTSGRLNPTWVEWLMGWPLGWTDLKPLEMDKSHSVPQQPGEF
jgi:hypothetical protein